MQLLIPVLFGILKRFLTERAMIKLVHLGLSTLAESTTNKVDDKFVKIYEDITGEK